MQHRSHSVAARLAVLATTTIACVPPGPPSAPVHAVIPRGATPGTVDFVTDGTRLGLVFALFDAEYQPTVAEGTLHVDVFERSPRAAGRTGRVVCSAEQAFARDAFAEADGWAATFDAPLVPSCPPAPEGPDPVREVCFSFSAGPEPGGCVDAPLALRGAYTREEAAAELDRREAEAAAGESAAAALAVRGRIDEYARSLAALVEIVASAHDVPTTCGTLPAGVAAPLVDEEDLAVMRMAFGGAYAAAPLRDRATQMRILRIISIVSGADSDTSRIAAVGGEIEFAQQLVWVRTRPTWVNAAIVEASPSSFVPGSFAATLYLVDRVERRLICGVPVNATNDDSVEASARPGEMAAALVSQLALELEREAWAATIAARQDLAGDLVPFDIPRVDD